jgi:hypothetical protein
MAENDEHESGAPREGTPPAEPGAAPNPGHSAAAPEGGPTVPVRSGADVPPPRGPGRVRRWSASPPARMGAITLVAGLIGGLVGGGIVAAFSDNGGGHGVRPTRVERMIPYGGPGFGPRYWGPPPGDGWGYPKRPGMPTAPPMPSPKTTG